MVRADRLSSKTQGISSTGEEVERDVGPSCTDEEDGEVTQYTTVTNTSSNSSKSIDATNTAESAGSSTVKKGGVSFSEDSSPTSLSQRVAVRRGTGIFKQQGAVGLKLGLGLGGSSSPPEATKATKTGLKTTESGDPRSNLSGAMSPVDLTPPASMSAGSMAAALSLQKENTELKAKVYSLENRLKDAKDENSKKNTHTASKQAIQHGETQLKHAAMEIAQLKHQTSRAMQEAQCVY